MGDMKTPDFDDLLAAFDIPDIDAKEAIQSAPDEVEGHQGAGGGSLIKPGDASVGGSSALRSPSPSTDSQSDQSIVSVIVKNCVHPEPFDGGDSSVPDPLNHNGFVSASGSVHMSQSRSQNGQQWPICSSKAIPETAGALGSSSTSKQGSNIFNKLKPLMAQGAGDSVGRARKMQLLQQQHMQQEITLEGADKAKAPAIPSGTSGAASPFFPPPKQLLSTPSTASSSSPSSSSPSVGSRVSGAVASSPLATSLTEPFNGSPRLHSSAFRRVDSDEEDSDPDSRGSLVIHESPDSPTPPKLSRRLRSPPEISQSPSLPPSTSISPSTYPRPDDIPLASPASPQAQQNWLSAPVQTGTGKSLPQEERNPEHVIEERDSPESPEPEIPKSSMPTSAVTKRSCSPAVASLSPSAALREPKEEEEEMEVDKGLAENGQDAANTDGMEDKKKDGEKIEVDAAQSLPADAGSPSSGGKAVSGGNAPSRPLKVRIKTIKTSTGGITRTVTRVAGKGGTARTDKDASKAQTGIRVGLAKGTKKIEAQVVKCSTLPVSTLEASSAMLAAASKVQNKMAMQSDKMKVSATAVSITKATTLPVAPAVGGISVRPTVSKTANGGTVPCKPASIVNSTGAVISRSQSSLVEAFNKILNSKNLLPSYRPDLSTPPPSQWGLPMPATGYRCLECGDAFALERSLARHYDRRSLRIEVTCNHCAKRLAFFNKCSLLLHAREHKERGLVMQCSHLVMRPVTVEQMIGQQDTTPIGMLSPSLSSPSLSSSTTPTGTTPVQSTSSPLKDSPSPGTVSSQPSPARRGPQSPQALMPLPCKKGEALQYHNFKCPECQTQFSSKTELVTHFQQIRATPNSTCMLCSPPMMLPNWCSVSAHQRIHKHRAPHVCPECGGTARQATFQTHLEESCLHFARRIGYRCSICQVVFGGLNSIKSHIQTAHCEVFHKCPNCPMAFKSAQSTQGHITSQHPALTAAQAKMIYKCVMCDTVFTQKPLLYMHFDTHLAKQKVHVFKCPDCTKLYAQKGSMMEHIKTAHRGLSVKAETPPTTSSPVSAPASNSASKPKPTENNSEDLSQEQGEEDEEGEEEEGEYEGEERDEGEEEENEEEDQTDSPENGSMEWRCKECKKRYAEREDYIDHMKNDHGTVMKKFPCRLCERSFSSANSLRRHVRIIHEGVKRVFRCPHCSEGKRTFSSRLILEKHIRVRHGIRIRQTSDRPNAPNTRKRSLPADGAGSSSELDNESGDPPVGGATDTDDITGEDPKRTRVSENRPLEQEEDDGTFRCTPCGFTTQDWEEFQHHIPVHCDTENAPQQCLQCGACFASAGSLSRHKFITHRLRQGQHDNHGGNASPGTSPQDGSPSSPKAGVEGEGGGGQLQGVRPALRQGFGP
ncbi:zinc finger protein 687b [Carassius gibelio]|uniref:zinc finger protein 687b n=1 Tax=Carassius gibelio TaxID=101364 RepID=UPI002278F419|nr:zinc finger protein 687b [Carassius gibelio]XP_052389912.1 zinc finger protein 687b [Carassius gibelio]XP_052389913.1 zinc finger protein 687b [Carassius gibelio]